MKDLINTFLRIEYSDHNEAFSSIFPRFGKITGKYKIKSERDWYLIKLDKSFEYNGINNTHILIRYRWEKHEIGEDLPTSVFVLLIPDLSLLSDDVLDIKYFHLAVWGMAYTIVQKG